MIRVQFTAARDLTGNHEAGDGVSLSFSAAELTPGREISRSVQIAIGGKRESLLHNSLRTWSVTTEPLALYTLDAMQEFLGSTEGGESFTFEPWGYDSGPALDLDFVTPRLRIAESVAVTMTSEGYQLQRLIGEGTGGADDWYQVNFTVKELP
jgi:hypothetical protein